MIKSEAEQFRDELAEKWPGRAIIVTEETWLLVHGKHRTVRQSQWRATIFAPGVARRASVRAAVAATLDKLRDAVYEAMEEA